MTEFCEFQILLLLSFSIPLSFFLLITNIKINQYHYFHCPLVVFQAIVLGNRKPDRFCPLNPGCPLSAFLSFFFSELTILWIMIMATIMATQGRTKQAEPVTKA